MTCNIFKHLVQKVLLYYIRNVLDNPVDWGVRIPKWAHKPFCKRRWIADRNTTGSSSLPWVAQVTPRNTLAIVFCKSSYKETFFNLGRKDGPFHAFRQCGFL